MKVLVFVLVLLEGGSVAQAQEPSLQQRASADSAFLSRVNAQSSTPTASALQDSVSVRLVELDSTYDKLLQSGNADAALRFALAMEPHWTKIDYTRALAQYKRAFAVVGAPSSARAAALNRAALLAFRQLDQASATAFNEEAVRIADRIGDKSAAISGHVGLARVALRQGDYPGVRSQAQIAVTIAESLNDTGALRNPMHLLAVGERLGGDLEKASRLYEFTLALSGLSGSRPGVAQEMLNLGFVRLHQNDTASAERLWRESLNTYASLDHKDAVYLLGSFAALAAVRHQPLRTATLYGAMSAELERLKISLDPDDQYEIDTYGKLARSETDASEFDRARAEGRKLTMRDAIALALKR